MAWAKAQKAGGPGIKAVLLVLADYCIVPLWMGFLRLEVWGVG